MACLPWVFGGGVDWVEVTVMLMCAAALALTGAALMMYVAAYARRRGYRSSTVFSRRRVARAARLAARPAPSADQRVASDSALHRVMRHVRHHRPAAPVSLATMPAPVRRASLDPVDHAVAVTAESAGSRMSGLGAAAPELPTTDRSAGVHSSMSHSTAARVVLGFDGVEADPAMLAALRRGGDITPEVIEADPIDVDVVNPARLTRSR